MHDAEKTKRLSAAIRHPDAVRRISAVSSQSYFMRITSCKVFKIKSATYKYTFEDIRHKFNSVYYCFFQYNNHLILKKNLVNSNSK